MGQTLFLHDGKIMYQVTKVRVRIVERKSKMREKQVEREIRDCEKVDRQG